MPRLTLTMATLTVLSACGSSPLGREPPFSPPAQSIETAAMVGPAFPLTAIPISASRPLTAASLWSGGRGSLLGDDRAMARGDILTVVIEIDDSAQISNSSDRSREGSQQMEVGALFGLPEALDGQLAEGASLSPGVDLASESNFRGEGSVRRAEELTLHVAATVTDILPNGVLAITGRQEVRVNFELRELLVSGFVRPMDVSRQNEVTYDKIAQARISYGGRGQISDMQQPRIGQQAVELLAPF